MDPIGQNYRNEEEKKKKKNHNGEIEKKEAMKFLIDRFRRRNSEIIFYNCLIFVIKFQRIFVSFPVTSSVN